MKFIYVILLTFTLTACIGSGQNSPSAVSEAKQFPIMTGIDLLGDDRAVPDSFQGTYNIVTVAFQREQQEQVNTWIEYATPLIKDNDTIRYYELPIIYEMSAMKRFWVNNGMRAGIPDADARERTITVYTERDTLINKMNWDKDKITTYILDNNGNILWRKDGVFDEKYKQEIEKIVQQ
jgi:hypothetical protein